MKINWAKATFSLMAAMMVVLFLGVLAWPGAASADSLDSATGDQLVQIARGGMLYDKWYGVTKATPPNETHPSYASSKGKRKGKGTWRCKECHGWDYMGKDGAYAKGSHFSGIVGMRGSAGGSMDSVVASLKGDAHMLGDHISSADLNAIAAFVTKGQLDMDQYIERSSKKAKGNLMNGERIYKTTCAKCHGMDGKEINFGNEKKSVFLGTVSNGNPWETLHKIRMGQPDEDMSAMIAFPVQSQVDVLAYSQTLPTK